MQRLQRVDVARIAADPRRPLDERDGGLQGWSTDDLRTIGYWAKVPCPRPDWLQAPQVELACSVSDCAAARRLPDEALGVTDGLGLFARIAALEHCVSADGGEALVRFAYRALPVVFGDGVADAEGQQRPLEHAAGVVEPIPASFVRLGFDVCEVHHTLECSPLFCNGQAEATATNRWCLLDDFDVAVRLARAWGKAAGLGVEPGPYAVLEVWADRWPA